VTQDAGMQCFSCGVERSLGAGERVGFRDCCEGCDGDLHVCRNCAHHDPSAYNECRESSAERVANRESANRCDYFVPGIPKDAGADDSRSQAIDDLESLFKK